MCFSATASFGAAALLSCIGALSVYKMPSKKYAMVAAIPLLFALQQASEGIVWITLNQADCVSLARIAMQAFVIVAWIIWPIWIPLSLLIIERNAVSKRMLYMPLVVGALFSAAVNMHLKLSSVTAEILQCHIVYSTSIAHPIPSLASLAIYCFAVITPFFFSSIKGMSSLGFLITTSLVISYLMWYEALTSVWCFFAALISVSIAYLLSTMKKSH